MKLPKITIIIPVKPGGSVGALAPLCHIDYPDGLLEIIVAEGSRPSRQRNMAAAAACGDILYFLDDDSLVSPGFLQRAVRFFEDPRVAVVGGPSLTPAGDSLVQKAFGAALSSLFGGGGVRNRYRQTGAARLTGDQELILCNLAFRKDVFQRFGGLDERLYPNEENELLDRLQVAGLQCIHDPQLAVLRSQRPSFRKFIRQLFGYGRGRGEQTRLSGKLRLTAFIPSLFFLYLVFLPLWDNPVYYLPLLCYAIAVAGFSVYDSGRMGSYRILPLLLVVFPALHLAYGIGLLFGLINPRFVKRRVAAGEVTLKRLFNVRGSTFDVEKLKT